MNSLEKNLQYSLAAVLILILVGLLSITIISTRHILQEFVTSRLEHDAKNLLDILDIKASAVKVRWRRINPIYNIPYSGHYYTITMQGDKQNEAIRSPSLQEEKILLAKNRLSTVQRSVPGPQNQRLIVWTKTYQKQGQDIVISVAEDMSSLKQRRKRFQWLFIITGIIGIALMLLMQRLIIRRLFQKLDHSRLEVKQIESGKKEQLSEDVPVEIYPLVKEFNQTLSLMQQRLERSRNALGNLAHALKTPLSILVQTLDVDKKDNQKAIMQAERIRQLTERELKRARMAGIGNTTKRFNPREELPVLCDVLKQAHQKEMLKIRLTTAENVTVFGDREDMLELLGNLLDNACKWAESQVSCSVLTTTINSSGAENIRIIIEDDGKGQTPDEIEKLTKRGVRLDESVEGSGLGLAICNDIVKLYGGSLRFGHSEKLGGFLVEVNLP